MPVRGRVFIVLVDDLETVFGFTNVLVPLKVLLLPWYIPLELRVPLLRTTPIPFPETDLVPLVIVERVVPPLFTVADSEFPREPPPLTVV